MELSDSLYWERRFLILIVVFLAIGLLVPAVLEIIEWYRENRTKRWWRP